MSTAKKAISVTELLSKLSASEPIAPVKLFTKLKPALKQKASDAEAEAVTELILRTPKRVQFYLKLIPNYTDRLMQPKNREFLIYRLFSPVKNDVKTALSELEPNITTMLDLLNDNDGDIAKWLAPAAKNGSTSVGNEDFSLRASLSYLYIALKMDKRTTARYERLLLSVIEKDSKLSFAKTTGKIFPDILLSKNILSQVEKLAYLHSADAESYRTAVSELTRLRETNERLNADYQKRGEELSRLRAQADALKTLAEDRQQEIECLNTKLAKAEGWHNFEVNRLNDENRIFQQSYTEKLTRSLATEIEGIRIILSRMDEPDRSRLQNRVSNIEKILSRGV